MSASASCAPRSALNRRAALGKLPQAVARLLDQLARARRIVNAGRTPARPLTMLEAAHLHYEELLALDAQARDFKFPPSDESSEVTVSDMNQMFGPGREKALLRVASGQSSDEETQALVGWAIEQMRERGAAAVPSGSPFWRTLATLTGSRAFRL